MGHLRINGETFELPQDLCGRQHVATAVMRGKTYVGVSLNGTCFNFGHAVMQALLNQLSDPSRDGEGAAPLVHQAIISLQQHFAKEVLITANQGYTSIV